MKPTKKPLRVRSLDVKQFLEATGGAFRTNPLGHCDGCGIEIPGYLYQTVDGNYCRDCGGTY